MLWAQELFWIVFFLHIMKTMLGCLLFLTKPVSLFIHVMYPIEQIYFGIPLTVHSLNNIFKPCKPSCILFYFILWWTAILFSCASHSLHLALLPLSLPFLLHFLVSVFCSPIVALPWGVGAPVGGEQWKRQGGRSTTGLVFLWTHGRKQYFHT